LNDKELKKLKNEMLMLRSRINQITTLSELKPVANRMAEINDKLKPYKCPHCFTIVYSDEDFVVKNDTRVHVECWRKMEEIRMYAEKKRREWDEKSKRVRYEVEHSLRRTYWEIWFPAYGYKKDFLRLMSDLPKIVRQYGLIPPKIEYEKGEKVYVHEMNGNGDVV